MDPFPLPLWPKFKHYLKESLDDSLLWIDEVSIDSRRIYSKNSLFIALKGEKQDGHRFLSQAASNGARFAVVDESVPLSEAQLKLPLYYIKVSNPLQSLQEIASAYNSFIGVKTIAICGSYGKTMAKDLLVHLLHSTIPLSASPESFNSQIGVALSLLKIKKSDQLALIEAGHSKKGELYNLAQMIKPSHAILTVLGATHLASFPNLTSASEEYIQLLESVSEKGWIVMPKHDSLIRALYRLKAKTFFWNEPTPLLPFVETYSCERSKKYRIHFPDGNQFTNSYSEKHPFLPDLIHIGIKTAWLLGIPSEEIIKKLSHYQPESMNSEAWTSPQGIFFVNEPYSDDPQSVIKALRNLPKVSGKKHFVFSGFKKREESHSKSYHFLAEEIVNSSIDRLILVGDHDYSNLIQIITKESPQTEVSLFGNREEALKQLRNRLKRDDLILFKGSRKESLEILAQEFTDIVKDTRLTINLGAIRSNIEVIRSHLSPKTRIMAMVKAFAYGTDPQVLCRFLSKLGVDIFGVAHVDEALSLRNNGIESSLFVINASLYEVIKVVAHNLEIGISDLTMVQALNNEALKQAKQIKVHLHIDTGMSRLGCRPEDALSIASAITLSSNLTLEGVMTHFASADEPLEDSFTCSQIECFEKTLEELKIAGISPLYTHIANSSGHLRFELSKFNMIRIGLAIFGLKPSPQFITPLPLRMALSLTSKVAGINRCKKGESISYGRTYKVCRETELIGVIPLGYFDGIHRHYSGRGHVLIRGKKAPMIGTVCMDFMMVDITDIPNVEIGDPVLIFGNDEEGFSLPPEEFALKGQTNTHELITCLGPRIQRIFVDDEK